ncbi:MAG: hypothetical protein KKH52_03035, partial [Nanoarchaeota archaeon]|nr:hypothetical protein [Nanoarchaeota archaeon]
MSILPEEAPDVVLYETGPIKLSNPEIATAVKKSLYIGVYDQVVWDKGPALLGFKLEEEKEIRRRLLVVGRDLSREPVTTDIASLTRYLDYQPNQFPTTIWNIIEQGNDNRTA